MLQFLDITARVCIHKKFPNVRLPQFKACRDIDEVRQVNHYMFYYEEQAENRDDLGNIMYYRKGGLSPYYIDPDRLHPQKDIIKYTDVQFYKAPCNVFRVERIMYRETVNTDLNHIHTVQTHLQAGTCVPEVYIITGNRLLYKHKDAVVPYYRIMPPLDSCKNINLIVELGVLPDPDPEYVVLLPRSRYKRKKLEATQGKFGYTKHQMEGIFRTLYLIEGCPRVWDMLTTKVNKAQKILKLIERYPEFVGLND